MEQLKFTTNWNKKLYNNFFTTLRTDLPTRFPKGKEFQILLREKEGVYQNLGIAEVVDHKSVKLNSLNDWILGLDTGYIGDEGKAIFRSMYKVPPHEDLRLSFVLLKYTSKNFAI
jgi:hypothetical protein